MRKYKFELKETPLSDIQRGMINVINESIQQLNNLACEMPDIKKKIGALEEIGKNYTQHIKKIDPETLMNPVTLHNITKQIKQYEDKVKEIATDNLQSEDQRRLSDIISSRVEKLQTQTDPASRDSKKLIQEGLRLIREMQSSIFLLDNNLKESAYKAANRYCFWVDKSIKSQHSMKPSQLTSKTDERRIPCR